MGIMRKSAASLWIACVISALLIGGALLFTANRQSPVSFVPSHIPCDPRDKKDVSWSIYRDERFRFNIDYRSDLPVRTLENFSKTVSYAVDFGGSYYDGPDGVMAVIIEPTQFQTPEEWLEAENRRLRESGLSRTLPNDYPISQFVVEKKVSIAGYPAIILNSTSLIKNEKTAIFIKDKYLFQIHGNGSSLLLCEDEDTINLDYERVWNSFRFEK